MVRRLRVPDGQVGSHIQSLTTVLRKVLSPDDLCLAPWRNDGHPDHDACGEAALAATRSAGALLLDTWSGPGTGRIPTAQTFPGSHAGGSNSTRVAARKRWATGAFRSQTRPLEDA